MQKKNELTSFALRLDPNVYLRIKNAALRDGVSMNTLISQALDDAVPANPNDLFEAQVSLNGPRHPMTVKFGDPVKAVAEDLEDAFQFLMDEADLLDYWQSFSQKQLALLVSLQRKIRPYRDAYLGAASKSKEAEEATKNIANLIEHLSELLQDCETVRRRRGKELSLSQSYSLAQVERVGMTLKVMSKNSKKV